jgi:hypothetical protein
MLSLDEAGATNSPLDAAALAQSYSSDTASSSPSLTPSSQSKGARKASSLQDHEDTKRIRMVLFSLLYCLHIVTHCHLNCQKVSQTKQRCPLLNAARRLMVCLMGLCLFGLELLLLSAVTEAVDVSSHALLVTPWTSLQVRLWLTKHGWTIDECMQVIDWTGETLRMLQGSNPETQRLFILDLYIMDSPSLMLGPRSRIQREE